MKVLLSEKEIKYLTRLLAAEYQKKNERMLHATSHGSDFYDPDAGLVVQLLEKLEPQL